MENSWVTFYGSEEGGIVLTKLCLVSPTHQSQPQPGGPESMEVQGSFMKLRILTSAFFCCFFLLPRDGDISKRSSNPTKS